jgi:hypothetical protein
MSKAICPVSFWARWMSAGLAAAHGDEPSFASIRAFDFSVLRTGMPQRPWQPSRLWHNIESPVA